MNRMWLVLITLSVVGLAPTYEAKATVVYKSVPRSYSGGVFLAHKRLVRKPVTTTSVSSSKTN